MRLSLSILFLVALLLVACTDIDSDRISDSFHYRPSLSVPLGKLSLQYDDMGELPVPPSETDTSLTWQERDTLYFDMSGSLGERQHILDLLLQFDITNGYPAIIDVDLYFIDDNGWDVYLIPSPIEVKAAAIAEDGRLVKEQHSIPYPYQVPLSSGQIDALLLARQLVIVARVNDLPLSSDIVNNFPDYNLYAALGIQARLEIPVNDD
ncbi:MULTISPECIES: hypothetical protein [unclassified Carboxylicivirga]|uniref:hypothetical protein n=1 Tax=Carboxylicivirga TaxID=1628153 RepID=UPI003D325BF4